MTPLLAGVAESTALVLVLGFVALYPLVTAAVWVVTALLYWRSREGADEGFYDLDDAQLPRVSILVPAYREALVLDGTLEALHVLNYPDYEVVVVDDGSPDDTAEVARRHAERDRRFRLLRKEVNEGKALAMNDAVPLLTGEIVVVVDADAKLRPEALRPVVAHFVRLPRVAAVTGNPRVANRTTLLAELQTLEFTSIVSLLRRAQVVWGRLLTVSGVISAFRLTALEDVGLFDPSMATEDIDVTWRLQRACYDVRYEPRALVDMTVPASWGALWRQRRRWALGLLQVLRRHAAVMITWRARRQWPVYVEACLSILWAHCFLAVVLLWAICSWVGVSVPGVTQFPNAWGMTVATACLAQLLTGVLLDSRYDPTVRRALWIAPLYPLAYWLLMSAVTVRSTVPALLTPQADVARWASIRESPRLAGVVVPDQRSPGHDPCGIDQQEGRTGGRAST
jgi:biofilm PGA synthesis N-glycosyltransferase PgaC